MRALPAVLLVLALLVSGPGAAAAGGETFVSLGDSFSSGEAASPYDRETDDKDGVKRDRKCHRSPDAWPRLLGVAREHHLACSGAKLEDLDRGQIRQPPDDTGQIARLRALAQGTHFDRILLTIGGNDIGFSTRILHCRFHKATCLNNMRDIREHLTRLGPKLSEHYQDVRDAGQAPLLVVGYPAIFPPAGAATHRCGWLGKRSQRRADQLTKLLDRQLEKAAQDARVDYVSMSRGGPDDRNVLAGHELCTKSSFVRPITSKLRDFAFDQQQAHPYKPGQQLMARRVEQWLYKEANGNWPPPPANECPAIEIPNTPITPSTSPVRATRTSCERARQVARAAVLRCFRGTSERPCNATRRYRASLFWCRQTKTTGFALPVICRRSLAQVRFSILLD